MPKHNKKTKKNNSKTKTRLEKNNIENDKLDYAKEINLSNSEVEAKELDLAKGSINVIKKDKSEKNTLKPEKKNKEIQADKIEKMEKEGNSAVTLIEDERKAETVEKVEILNDETNKVKFNKKSNLKEEKLKDTKYNKLDKDNSKKEKIITFFTTLGIALIILAAILIHKYDLIYKIKVAINPITITNINLEIERTELEMEETLEIKCKITPENYTVSNFKWYSSDENIAEVKERKNNS